MTKDIKKKDKEKNKSLDANKQKIMKGIINL